MTAFLNVGSLVLGLAAWGLPFAALRRRSLFWGGCLGSLSCCIFSLLFQLFEVRNRVDQGDWSALMDTIPAVVLAAVVMIVVMLICNIVALLCAARR